MKILLISIAYNEEDLVPYFLNYYEKICDKIIVYDNMSTDNTEKLLKKSKKVEIKKFNTNNCFSDEKHKEIKNNEWKKYNDEYDWVILTDFDEFLYHPNLMEKLEEYKRDGISIPCVQGIQTKTFNNLLNNETNTYDILDKVPYGKLDILYGKNIIFDPKKIKEMNYNLGAHKCDPIGTVKFSKDCLFLLHFKKLGKEFEYKKHSNYASRTFLDKKTNNLNFYKNMLKDIDRRYNEIKNPLIFENVKYKELIKKSINNKVYSYDKLKNIEIELLKNQNKSICIITTWINYSIDKIYQFLYTLKHNFKEETRNIDLVIFYNDIDELDKNIVTYYLKDYCNVVYIKYDNLDLNKYHINTVRHLYYYNYLDEHIEKYDKTLLVDIRDIVFQNNSILSLYEKNKVFVFSEDKLNTKIIPWDEECCGLIMDKDSDDFKKLLNDEYYCAGVIFGEAYNIKKLCKYIFDYVNIISDNDVIKLKHFSTESAAFNYIINFKIFDFIKCIEFGTGCVFTIIRYFYKSNFKIDFNTNNILNDNNDEYSILHFNGYSEVHKFFKNQYYFNTDFLQKDIIDNNKDYIKMLEKKLYDEKFYKKYDDDSFKFEELFAKCIVKYFNIRSVFDVGCGVGRWLKGAKDAGIKDVFGIEYSYDDAKKYIYDDVKNDIMYGDATKELNFNKTFDCVWSFEVAEHLPKDCAEQYVENLILNSNRFIVISAAPPGQGGVGHINLQPKQYWIDLFLKYNNIYYRKDVTESLIKVAKKENCKVGWWVERNLMVFEKNENENNLFKFSEKETSIGNSNTVNNNINTTKVKRKISGVIPFRSNNKMFRNTRKKTF